jgi:hypothetical protein
MDGTSIAAASDIPWAAEWLRTVFPDGQPSPTATNMRDPGGAIFW